VTLAAVITAWAYSNWADRWPGLGWTPRGRAVWAGAVPVRHRRKGHRGWRGTPARHTGPGSPTAEDGSSGA